MAEPEEYHDKDPTKNVRELVKAEIKRLDDLATEREKTWHAELRAVHDRFDTAERQRVENKIDSRTAVDAALAAAKELVIAQATTAGEAMQQQARTTEAALKGITDGLSDAKERIGKIENIKLGSEALKTDQRSNIGTIFGAAGVLFGLAMLAVAAFTAINGGG